MTPHAPAPRCPRCKTVLSHTWTDCQVCHATLMPRDNPMMTTQCRLQRGWTVAYRDAVSRQLHDGIVEDIDLTDNQLLVRLRSGLTIKGQHICSVGEVDAKGQIVAAYQVTEHDLVIPIQCEGDEGDPPMSIDPWLERWRRIADATQNIRTGEPRLRPILDLLTQCDQAYEQQHHETFSKAEQRLTQFLAASTPRSRPQLTVPDSHTG